MVCEWRVRRRQTSLQPKKLENIRVLQQADGSRRAGTSIEVRERYEICMLSIRTFVVALVALFVGYLSLSYTFHGFPIRRQHRGMAAALKFLTVAPRAKHTATVIFVHVRIRFAITEDTVLYISIWLAVHVLNTTQKCSLCDGVSYAGYVLRSFTSPAYNQPPLSKQAAAIQHPCQREVRGMTSYDTGL